MRPWISRARRAFPFALSGAAMTIFMASGLPLLLAMRGIGPGAQTFSYWKSEYDSSLEPPAQGYAFIEVNRGFLADTYLVNRAGRLGESLDRWPTGGLRERDSESTRVHHPPHSVITEAPLAEVDDFYSIGTTLTGWPFRAFASESWHRLKNGGASALPEFRCATHLGVVDGRDLLIPHRPLVAGIVADLAFWTSASWAAVAFPLALRRRKREKYGKCVDCGHALDPHAVTRLPRCPECGISLPHDPLGFVRSPEMHFQNAYVWFIFISSLDIMLTWKILDMNGVEVNPVAALIINDWGMQGAVAFKFALVMWVIVMCELLARLRRSAGRFLAIAAIIISALPVVWSLALLTLHTFMPSVFE